MKIEINQPFDIPNSTPQQRKIGGKGTHPTEGLRYARAAWQALFEKYKPVKPASRNKGIHLVVYLYYYTNNSKLGGSAKTTRPDGDNLLKIIKDAMTKAGYWEDDAQVYYEQIARYWTRTDSQISIIVSWED